MSRSRYFLFPVLCLCACVPVGPVYTPPSIDVPENFFRSAEEGGRAIEEAWWMDLADRRLDQLVETGLKRNLDILSALERIRSAEAAVRARGADALASGAVSTRRTGSGGEERQSDISESHSLSAQFVLDLFGEETHRTGQARARAAAARYDAGTVRLAFLSSLVSNYLDLRHDQEALALTRKTIASRERTFEIVSAKREAGIADSLELERARASLNGARAALPALEEGFYSHLYAIAALLDMPDADLASMLETGGRQPYPRTRGKAGTPADLLRNRPDIRAAERELAAAVDEVGISAAALYPSLRLSGTITASSLTGWSFGPELSLPVLGRGAMHARRAQAESGARLAELAWRKAVRAAVEDVQGAEGRWSRSRRDVAAQREIVASQQKILELTRQSYEAGAIPLLDLLDAERNVSSAQMSLAGAVRDAARTWSELQIAAGRGWKTATSERGAAGAGPE